MEMSNKKQQIPAIRFNGFTDAWEQRKLISEIDKVLDYRGKSPIKFGMNWGSTGYLVLSALNVKDGYIDKTIDAKYGDQALFERWMGSEKLEEGDVIFTTEAPLGHVAQVPDEDGYILNQRAVGFKTNPENLNNNFLAQLLRSPLFQTILQANASGGTAKGIGMKEFAKLDVIIPSEIVEQKQIGNFFNLIDSTIALHQRQLDNYKELQKSLLQKIFNQELRFKDKYGDDYPEWEKEKLGNLITEVVEKSTIQDQYPILSSTNKGLFLQSEYFKSNIASDDNIGYKILRQNEIVFSPQNLWMGNINFNDKYEAGIVSPSYKIFSVNDGIVHEFMKFMIKTQYMMNEYVLSSEQGASIVRRNLDMELFNKIKVKIPTIPEQKKITDFLIASDDQIDQVAQKLERLKEQKKGLMQRMFV